MMLHYIQPLEYPIPAAPRPSQKQSLGNILDPLVSKRPAKILDKNFKDIFFPKQNKKNQKNFQTKFLNEKLSKLTIPKKIQKRKSVANFFFF